MDHPKDQSAANRNKRPYPRGESPFCSPKEGDILESESGIQREVLNAEKPETHVRYRLIDSDEHEVAKQSWAQWCSKSKARLVSRNGEDVGGGRAD